MTRPALLWFYAAILMAAPLPGAAQSRIGPTVAVGSFTAEKTCTIYQTLWATRYVWGTDLVRDCVKNFASIRGTVQSALAASGKLRLVDGSASGYTISGHIDHVGIDETSVTTPSMALSTAAAVVAVDVRVRDAAGRIVYGGVLTKHADSYNGLQNAIALATARLVSFRIAPLRVTSTDGRHIALNYGTPLVGIGAAIQVLTPDGTSVRYNVTAASGDSATGIIDNNADPSQVRPGMTATFIEPDDAAANARRFDRVDLP